MPQSVTGELDHVHNPGVRPQVHEAHRLLLLTNLQAEAPHREFRVHMRLLPDGTTPACSHQCRQVHWLWLHAILQAKACMCLMCTAGMACLLGLHNACILISLPVASRCGLRDRVLMWARSPSHHSSRFLAREHASITAALE